MRRFWLFTELATRCEREFRDDEPGALRMMPVGIRVGDVSCAISSRYEVTSSKVLVCMLASASYDCQSL